MNGRKASIFHDRYGDLNAVGFIAMIVAVILITCVVTLCTIAIINIYYREGIETTVTGTIQLHQLQYSKLWNLKYTNCEMLTYSGDTHHIEVKNHVELEYGATYRIKFVAVNYWCHLKLVNEIVEIYKLN